MITRYDIHARGELPIVRVVLCQDCVEDIFEHPLTIDIVPHNTQETAGICMNCSRVVHSPAIYVHQPVKTIQ